ncbi:MAG: gamma-glutamyltransferase family protein [Sulfolobales archaeon]
MFRTPFISTSDLVVSEHPIASVIGAKILSSGGNAVDAAVATSFALSVLQPQLSGLGGDYFALIYKEDDGRIYFINGSGYSSKNANADHLRTLGINEIRPDSPYSITVPGMVDSLYNMWSRFGVLEWEKLVRPAVELANKGFPQYPSLVKAIRDNYDLLVRDEGSRTTYLSTELGVGNIIKFPNLGKALQLISEDYRNFYEGDIANSIVNCIGSKGGFIDYSDLKDYRSFWDDPIKIEYRGYQVFETPPNTQGITTLHLLRLLSDIDSKDLEVLSSERIETFFKLFRAAYRIRDRYVGDPRYVKKDLLSSEVIGELFKALSEELLTTKRKISASGDTTYYVVSDKYGNVVSGIQSIFYAFGSGITEPNYGVTFNCRGSSFNLVRGDINELSPRKYPFHTLSSVIVLDSNEQVRWALGTSGGHYRPQIHAELITHLIDYGLDPQTSIELPRFLWDPSTNELIIEEGFKLPNIDVVNVKTVKYPSRLGVAAVLEVRRSVEGNIKLGASDIRGDGLGLSIGFP